MAPPPDRWSLVTQITIATDEAVVVVEWSLSGRKPHPGQSTPGKTGLWVDFWETVPAAGTGLVDA